jgi:hypothetical protein
MDTPDQGTPASVFGEVTRVARLYELGPLRQSVEMMRELGLFKSELVGTGNWLCQFEAGLVRGRPGAAPEVFRWDQVETVWQSSTHVYLRGMYQRTNFWYGLTRSDGTLLRIDGSYLDPALSRRGSPTSWTYRYAMLGQAAATQVAQAQLPGALAALRSGQSLAFGDIVINTSGIQGKHSATPWSSIWDVQVSKGIVRIKTEGKFLPLSRRPVGKIPNFLLFVALTDALRLTAQS